MKKITLLIAALFGVASFAQKVLPTNGESVVNVSSSIERLVDCIKEEASTQIANGFGNTIGNEVADNFVVAADESFAVEEGLFTFLASTDASLGDITVRFYTDNGDGFPETLIAEEVVTADITNNGPFNGSFDTFTVEYVLATPVVLDGQAGVETTYWVSAFTPDSDGVSNFLETGIETDDTTLVAFKDGTDPDDDWANEFINTNGDVVQLPPAAGFSLYGDCSELVLNTDENLLGQVSFFPNPATNVVNVKVPSSVEVLNISVFDILGKKVNVSFTNGQVNVASIAAGVYLMSVETTVGTITEKVIKK